MKIYCSKGIEKQDSLVDKFYIDKNQTWQQLKSFTSITDESNSLQFKWNLSNLEQSYLDSLSLTRMSNQVSFDIWFMKRRFIT